MATPARRYRILVADDEETVVACYLRAFSAYEQRRQADELEELGARLFSPESIRVTAEPLSFDVVTCGQGDEAVDIASDAHASGVPFDVVILDIRMPPGISGVEAGERIRGFDAHAILIFVTGYSDTSQEELVRRIPPPSKLRYLNKPLSFRKLVNDVAEILGG